MSEARGRAPTGNRPLAPLPIDTALDELLGAIERHGAAVLVAPPGSGKTTRVPPALALRARTGGRVVVLQPRRIAARAAAARIAEERGWRLGGEVGYTVRFERRTSRDTRVEVVTEGILTRRLQADPFLEGVGAVVLDEFHERSIHADLALAVLREVKKAGRDDLRILVMSATLDPEPVARFLGEAPVITAGGRPHPVEIRHVDGAPRGAIHESAAAAVRESWKLGRGHLLVFLPGLGEIRRTAEMLEGFAAEEGAIITPLHGSLSLEEQDRALRPTRERRIVLATNIAETSLTIEGVDIVVDSGHARVLRNDPRHGIDRLELTRISRHSADQRAGRAGRLGPGVALRLWSRAEHQSLAEAETPEIRRVDLASTVLELRAWGVADAQAFEWFEKPEAAALDRAEGLLESLGAVAGRGGQITELGKTILSLPTHPRIARMLVEAHRRGVLEEGAAVAALLEERDLVPLQARGPARAPPGVRETGPSDLLQRLDLLAAAEEAGFRGDRCRALGVDGSAGRAVARARDDLLRIARDALGREGSPPGDAAAAETALLRVLLQGYPDRVCRRRAPGSDRGRMTGGRGVVLAPESLVRDDELFIAAELDENTRGERLEARVRLASAIRREWLRQDFPGALAERTETWFDPETQKVRSTLALCYRDLPLEEPRDTRPPPEEAERQLGRAAREHAVDLVEADEEAAPWLRRVRCLREWMPELGLPAFDAAELGEILATACAGWTSFSDLRKAGLKDILTSRLERNQARALEAHAPQTIQVPTGNHIRLAYEVGKPPVLAVRLQELFGLEETPAVAAGRVRVLLHLLGPNFRPVQITQDLRSFWNTTYAQVRKDLRARYPKHAWPEDPWTAPPQAGARRRRPKP